MFQEAARAVEGEHFVNFNTVFGITPGNGNGTINTMNGGLFNTGSDTDRGGPGTIFSMLDAGGGQVLLAGKFIGSATSTLKGFTIWNGSQFDAPAQDIALRTSGGSSHFRFAGVPQSRPTGSLLTLLQGNNSVFLAGSFESIGGLSTSNIAEFDGSNFTPLKHPGGLGLAGFDRLDGIALEPNSGRMFASGSITPLDQNDRISGTAVASPNDASWQLLPGIDTSPRGPIHLREGSTDAAPQLTVLSRSGTLNGVTSAGVFQTNTQGSWEVLPVQSMITPRAVACDAHNNIYAITERI